MADNQTDAMQRIASSATVIRALCHSEYAKALCAMLDALMDSYKIDLMYVTPEKLSRLQACILQIQAIRNTVADESKDLPKI